MNQKEKRHWLIEYLLEEGKDRIGSPDTGRFMETEAGEKQLLRALFNVRPPEPATEAFYEIQDAYLQEENADRGITQVNALEETAPGICIWRGDITTLAADAIVNAANEYMLGCFIPNHRCIDNAVHTYAGVQLRLICADLMHRQGHPEPTGQAKITPGYNLPAAYVIHTVGPIVQGALTKSDRDLLASCYRSCLETAEQNGITSLAFCCISTGEFHFPNVEAAEIAVRTVRAWQQKNRDMRIIFNVFKEEDDVIYRSLF